MLNLKKITFQDDIQIEDKDTHHLILGFPDFDKINSVQTRIRYLKKCFPGCDQETYYALSYFENKDLHYLHRAASMINTIIKGAQTIRPIKIKFLFTKQNLNEKLPQTTYTFKQYISYNPKITYQSFIELAHNYQATKLKTHTDLLMINMSKQIFTYIKHDTLYFVLDKDYSELHFSDNFHINQLLSKKMQQGTISDARLSEVYQNDCTKDLGFLNNAVKKQLISFILNALSSFHSQEIRPTLNYLKEIAPDSFTYHFANAIYAYLNYDQLPQQRKHFKKAIKEFVKNHLADFSKLIYLEPDLGTLKQLHIRCKNLLRSISNNKRIMHIKYDNFDNLVYVSISKELNGIKQTLQEAKNSNSTDTIILLYEKEKVLREFKYYLNSRNLFQHRD